MGDFQSSILVGVRLRRYPAALTTSGHRFSGRLALIRINRALTIIVCPAFFAAPFCSGVYKADFSTAYPSPLIQVVNLFLNEVSLSVRKVLTLYS
jgi:hypothetical protein